MRAKKQHDAGGHMPEILGLQKLSSEKVVYGHCYPENQLFLVEKKSFLPIIFSPNT